MPHFREDTHGGREFACASWAAYSIFMPFPGDGQIGYCTGEKSERRKTAEEREKYMCASVC